MIYYALVLSLLVWPFGQLLSFDLSILPTTVYFMDFSMGVLTISLLCSSKARDQLVKDRLFWPLVVFLSAASLSLLININGLSGENILISVSYLLRLFVYPSAYFAVKHIAYNRIKLPLTISISLFCALGTMQYALMPDMRYLKLIGFDDHYYRLVGTFFDPNFTGAILGGVSLAAIGFYKWTPAVITLVMLALTFSRASYLSFSSGLILLLIKQKRIIYISLLALLAFVIFVIPKPFGEGVNLLRTFSIFSRIDSWYDGLALLIQKPVFGWGYNTLRSITGERYQIDNSFIYVAATTGVLGITSFIYLIYRSFKSIRVFPGFLFIISLVIHSLFNNGLFYIWIFFAYWVVLGLSSREYKQS